MAASILTAGCLLTLLPSQPQIAFEDSYLQLIPIVPPTTKKCSDVELDKYITFTLYTRYNPSVSQPLRVGDDKLLEDSYIDFSQPTVIYFHAFFESSTAVSGTLVREAYMLRGQHNLIMVSGRELYAGPWYPTAARNTEPVGLYTAKLIRYLYKRGLKPSMLHLVGHSLGAQAAGVAGNALKKRKPARITGLDPALPLFQNLPLSRRLDRNDAHFVDIIHTDAGIFGISAPMGHADFYVNGGKSPQPGCELEVVLKNIGLLQKFFCSHWKSFQLYAETVLRPQSYPIIPCQPASSGCDKPISQNSSRTLGYMGFAASPRIEGSFYVRTSAIYPYTVE